METKICKCCGQELPVNAFSVSKHAKDGLQSWCKGCQKEYNRKIAARKRMSEQELVADCVGERFKGCRVQIENGKVIITPATEQKKMCQFKAGDVIMCRSAIAIFKAVESINAGEVIMSLYVEYNRFSHEINVDGRCRGVWELATDGEKERLFGALEQDGLHWDVDKKELIRKYRAGQIVAAEGGIYGIFCGIRWGDATLRGAVVLSDVVGAGNALFADIVCVQADTLHEIDKSTQKAYTIKLTELGYKHVDKYPYVVKWYPEAGEEYFYLKYCEPEINADPEPENIFEQKKPNEFTEPYFGIFQGVADTGEVVRFNRYPTAQLCEAEADVVREVLQKEIDREKETNN